MKNKYLTTFLLCLLVFLPTSCMNQAKIFKKFATKNEVGNIGDMVFDGHYYWIRGLMGPSFCYDATKNDYKQLNPQKTPQLGSIMCMEIVNGNVWFGLEQNGVAVYDPKMDNFKLMTYKDGLPYYLSSDRKFSRVLALKYDRDSNGVWVGLLDKGVIFYNLKTGKWIILTDPIAKKLNAITIALSGKELIIGANEGLYILNKSSNTWKSIGDFANKLEYDNIVVSNYNVYFVNKNNDESMVSIYNLNTGEIKKLLSTKTDISFISVYNNKYLIYCTNQGIIFYNLSTKKEKILDTSYGIISNWVNSVYIEGENLWVLTQDGISKGKIKDVLKELEEINLN